MAKNQDYNNLGDIVSSIVDEAISSMDFDQLNKNITGSIQSVFDELNIDVNIQSEEQRRKKEDYIKYKRGGNRTAETIARLETEKKNRPRRLVPINPPGYILGPLLKIFGIGGIGLNGFIISIILIMFLTGAFQLGEALIVLAVFIPFLLLGIFMFRKGKTIKDRVNRFRNYMRTIGDRSFVKVIELARAIGRDEDYVIKDLEDMIDKHFFPHGHMDYQRTHLMLDDESYKQYMESQNAYEERVKAQQRKAEAARGVPEGVKKAFSTDDISDPELAKAMEEGNTYMYRIRHANDLIPDEEITEKLDRMEELIRQIFDVLKKRPDQLPKLRKFMKYYMPTTLKLVSVYQELDAQPVEGENIKASKMEISETFDTINLAYEKLLDSFFETAAMDVSSDISVLETMFAQEGLTKSDPF